MTTPTNQIVRSSGTWFICGIAAILLSGCVSNSGFNHRASPVTFIPDEPIQGTVSAAALRQQKTTGTTILALPNDKLLADVDDSLFVDDVVVFGRDGSLSSGANQEEFDNLSVTRKSRTCLDWIDLYSGDPSCFSVTKSGGRILLNGKRRTFVYQVQD